MARQAVGLVAKLWHATRSRSVYFQLKLLVVVAYGVLSLATLSYVFGPWHGSRNDLGARVTVLEGDPVMGRYFLIHNESGDDWLAVRFEVDDGFRTRRDVVLAGEAITLYLRDFARPQTAEAISRGEARVTAHPAMRVTELRITTRDGVTRYPLLFGP